MSKKIIYGCNFCGSQTSNLKVDNWIEISSNNGSLKIINYFTNRNLIEMNNHSDIHYCGAKCFIDQFIQSKEADNEKR